MSYHADGKSESIYTIPVDNLVLKPDLKNVCLKAGQAGINAAVGAATLLFNTDPAANGLFYFTDLIVIAQNINTHTSVASLSIGTNGAAYDNILAITAQTGLTATGKFLITPLGETAISAPAAATGVYLKITTPAVGTTETYAAYLLGFYEDFGARQNY